LFKAKTLQKQKQTVCEFFVIQFPILPLRLFVHQLPRHNKALIVFRSSNQSINQKILGGLSSGTTFNLTA